MADKDRGILILYRHKLIVLQTATWADFSKAFFIWKTCQSNDYKKA